MNYDVSELEQQVRTNVSDLVKTSVFEEWLTKQRLQDNNIVLLNNSYIFRSAYIKTSKNQQYLCIKVKADQGRELDLTNIMVIRPYKSFNSDFTVLSSQEQELPTLQTLEDALRAELDRLGKLIFVLIGELEDCPAQVSLNHSMVKGLKFDPFAIDYARIDTSEEHTLTIVVKQISDPDKAWRIVEAELADEIGDFASLRKAFDPAFEMLQETARTRLNLPTSSYPTTNPSFQHRMHESVSQQRRAYEDALQSCIYANGTDNLHGREVMRIAYNFADDAVKVLQTLVSICDIKAIFLWCTIKEHLDAKLAFQSLPWTRSDKKPSMGDYQSIINGARNHAFHNLFNFDRTIEATLEGVSFKARSLTLLPSFGRQKSTVTFDYDDRELVEVLSGLSRASEMAVPLDFWIKNGVVMESFERLLEQSEATLWALHRALS